jgi:hypothetical protein
MRSTTGVPPRRAICAALALVVFAHAAAAADGQTATATLWSADRSFAPCRTARVEMIVGGVPASPDCGSGAATASASAGDRAARVDANAQRVRDDDRRGILLQEVAREREGLARLSSAPASEANRQAIERTRTNLAALQRELARTP